MESEIIEKNSKSGIVEITLNRPEKRNAVSRNLLNLLEESLKRLSTNKDKRILLIQANGPVFCAGADLKERMSMPEPEVFSFLDQFNQTLVILENMDCPTIACLHGDAFGGGLELALSCDFRIMSDSASVGLTEARLGIIPGAGGTQRLPRILGISKAKELIYSGKKVSADEAIQIGLVNKVCTKLNFDQTILEFTEDLLKSAPLSLSSAKEAIQNGFDLPLPDALKVEREAYKKTFYSDDRYEALNAFQEKRNPIFKGK